MISAGNLVNERSFNTWLYVKMHLFLFYFSLVLELCSLLHSHVTFFERDISFSAAYIDNTVHLDPCSVKN